MTGDELRALRDRNSLTMRQLAEILGVSTTTVGRLLNDERTIKPEQEAKLSEYDVAPSREYVPRENAQAVLEPDELPTAPYNPSEQEPEPPPEEKPKTSSRRREPGVRRVAGWQAEATEFLASLIRGQQLLVATPEGTTQIVIPGLAHGVSMLWCPQCALILANAADPWAAAFVKAYPQLARRLLVPGPQAELVIVSVTQIAIPCVMHHIHLGHGADKAASNGGEGQPAEHPSYEDMPGG